MLCESGHFVQDLKVALNKDSTIGGIGLKCHDPVLKSTHWVSNIDESKYMGVKALGLEEPYYVCGVQFKMNVTTNHMEGLKAKICMIKTITSINITYDMD